MPMKLVVLPNMCKSAEIVCSIDDLLTQILLRLPIRSLIRFKSVSKYWFSLITNPNFCNLRSSREIDPAIRVFFSPSRGKTSYEYIPFNSLQNPRNAPPINFDFTEDPSRCIILHSCNGLLLVCCSISSSCNTFYVYNPTTNSKTAIEGCRGYPIGNMLVFDPVESPHYKLLFVRWLENAYRIQIYSSETGVWRIGGEIERDIGDHVDLINGAYWNGSIHWISNSIDEKSLRFHVETQMLEEMPTLPYENVSYYSGACYFRESCDHLHYIPPGPQFTVYEMKRDYSEWFVKYFVDLSPVIVAHPEMIKKRNRLFYYFSILSLVHGEKEEDDSILFLLIPGKVIKYNLVDGSFEKLCEFEDDRSVTLDGKGFHYIESLSCV